MLHDVLIPSENQSIVVVPAQVKVNRNLTRGNMAS
jgi:hypothetical protein